MSANRFDGHTPGPWFWYGPHLKTKAALGRKPSLTGWAVSTDEDRQPYGPWGAPEANRELIAAAPDLLAQRNRFAELLSAALDSQDVNGYVGTQLCDEIRAALSAVEVKS